MDELSPLFQDIEFRERLRGYDVEEVDAYIDRVARAAALVQGRIAELQQRVEAAESRVVQPVVPAAVVGTAESEESVGRMLMLAQRTADAAIAEADAEAAHRRAEADEYASRVLAEAETDRRRTIADAQSEAAEAAAAEEDRIAVEIGQLEEYKAFLTEDIAILESHLADTRLALAASLSGLTDLLEQPEAFRMAPMPATSGALAPDALDATELTDAPTEADESDLADEADNEPLIDLSESASADEPPQASVVAPDVEAPVFEDAAEAVADSPALDSQEPAAEIMAFERSAPPDTVVFEDAVAPDAVEEIVEAEPSSPTEVAPVPDAHAVQDVPASEFDFPPATIDLVDPEPESALDEPAPPAPPLLVTAADLGGAAEDEWVREIHVDSGPITEPVPTVADQLLFQEPETSSRSDDPFLEQLRAAVTHSEPDDLAEDALAAFFDSEQDDSGRSWFPRRR